MCAGLGGTEHTALQAATWTPGLTLSAEGLLSEVITLRGARRGSKLAPAVEAAAALDSWLMSDGELYASQGVHGAAARV